MTPSTYSLPRSYSTLLTRPTHSFSRTPGRRKRVQLLVRRVHHRAGLGEQAISSGVLIRRASRNTCCPSTTSRPSAWSAARIGISTRSTPTGSFVEAVLAQHGRDLAGDLLGDAGVGVERAAQGRDAGPGPLGAVEPRVEQLVVPGRRAEVPQDRLAAARQHGEPDQLVHRPGADVGRRHVADVGEVERQQGAERGRLERRGAGPAAPSRRRSRSTRCSQSTALGPKVRIAIQLSKVLLHEECQACMNTFPTAVGPRRRGRRSMCSPAAQRAR